MKDRELLERIYSRLVHTHHQSALDDDIMRLRQLIETADDLRILVRGIERLGLNPSAIMTIGR